jgi:hypothetical protein
MSDVYVERYHNLWPARAEGNRANSTVPGSGVSVSLPRASMLAPNQDHDEHIKCRAILHPSLARGLLHRTNGPNNFIQRRRLPWTTLTPVTWRSALQLLYSAQSSLCYRPPTPNAINFIVAIYAVAIAKPVR